MKSFGVILLAALAMTFSTAAQEKPERIIIGAGLGVGVTSWQTDVTSPSNSYDGGGVNIPFQLEAMYCTKWIRVGIGIAFEQLFIDSLKSTATTEPGLKFKNQKVGFSKLFLQLESYPIQKNKLNLGLMLNAGIYRLDDQFSQNVVSNQILFSTGLIGEYKLTNLVRLYVNPLYEYKYYDLSKLTGLQDIQHKLGSGTLIIGIRYLAF